MQDLHKNIFWIFILYPALIFWYFAIQRFIFNKTVGSGDIPDQALLAFWIVFGIFFPFMLYCTKHITEVRKDGIYIRFIPLNRSFKKIPFYIVQECKIQQYELFKGKASGQNTGKKTEEKIEEKTEEEAGIENKKEYEKEYEKEYKEKAKEETGKRKATSRKTEGAPVVILQLISGKKMLISSKQPEELCKAIREAATLA